ncbi:ASNSD1 upstream open reading frame protein-like [Centruroides vittatus]|uniref:ASNSD1 upstream open reading frame protein-like n=1 Tax=Centruroides vittatus TaxID=120091 RepID=UPI00350FEAD8
MSKHNQLTKELEELNVLNSELKNLKKTARVYRQQPNSHIFFLDDISNVKCKTKESIKETEEKLKQFQNKEIFEE